MSRRTRRAAAVAAGVLSLLAIASPAVALEDGEQPGPPLSTGLVLVYYVLIPLGAFAVIALLAVLPSMLRRPRYRPGKAWNFDPLWFAGPAEPEQALVDARPGATARGGASAEW